MSSSFVSSFSISATNSEEISAICEDFLELSISEEKSEKMVKIMVESFSEDALRKLFNDLSKKEYWDAECEMCSMPQMLHKGPCTRKTEVSEADYIDLWKTLSVYKKKMEPIRRWHEDEMAKRQSNSKLLLGLQNMTDAIINGNKEMYNGFKDRPSKLVKPAKVPSWSKGMKLDVYVKSLQV